MIRIRPAGERGITNWGWLDSRHTFSFAEYYDPRQTHFRALRVINDDRIAGGGGFGTHPHRDMEILTWVIEGVVEHKDSMGNGTQVRPGELQRMTAGTGITHSEFNPSATAALRLLQIWIIPASKGLKPSYEQTKFEWTGEGGKLKLVASPDGREGSVTIHQDASVYVARLEPGDEVGHAIEPGRSVWVQVAVGEVELNGERLAEGDGAAVSEEQAFQLRAGSQAEVLVFDLN